MTEAQIAALECEVAELREHLPMLTRLAALEAFGGSVPSKILALEDHTNIDTATGHSYGSHFDRSADEVVPVAAREMLAARARWEMAAS